jgi:hypothetical protein
VGFTECFVNVDVDVDVDKDTKGAAFRAVKPMFCHNNKGVDTDIKGGGISKIFVASELSKYKCLNS